MKRKSLFLKDHPATKDWTQNIGQLIMNWGGIELLSLSWVDALGQDDLMHGLAAGMPFSRRLELIKRLIDRTDIQEDTKQRAKDTWDEIKKHSQLRNSIAHNPLILQFDKGKEAGPPKRLFLIDMKSLIKNPKNPKVLESLEELSAEVNEVARLAQEIEILVEEFMKES